MIPLSLLDNVDNFGSLDVLAAGDHDGSERGVYRSPADRRVRPQCRLHGPGQGSAPFLRDPVDGDVEPSIPLSDDALDPLAANDLADSRCHRGRAFGQHRTRHRAGKPGR